MKIAILLAYIVSISILALLENFYNKDTVVFIPLILSILLNIYYFIKLQSNLSKYKNNISNVKHKLYTITPIIFAILGFLYTIDSFTQLFSFSTAYYDKINATIIFILNSIILIYLSDSLTNSSSDLLRYTFKFLLRYMLLALPFLISGAIVSTSIRAQYTIGAIIIPLFYISISIFAALPTLKMNRESDYGGGYIGQLGGYSANDYRREILLMFINRALYFFAVFTAVVGTVNYIITWADISYVTYDTLFTVANSFNSTYPIWTMLLIYLAIAGLVVYIFWTLSNTDKFFKDNHVPINIKYLDNLIVRRLASVAFIASMGYLLFTADHILSNFMHNYKIYRLINKKLEAAEKSVKPAPDLDYSKANNTPRRNVAIIYLESMNEVNTENKYFENLTPTLTKLKDEGIYFANNKQVYGQKNSKSGIFSSQCGRLVFFDRTNDNQNCLGNVLNKYGYYQEFVQGWPVESLHFDEMFKSFTYNKLYGYDELKDAMKQNDEAKEKTGTPINKYFTPPTSINYDIGYTDKTIFEFAMGEFERLYKNSSTTPFVITLFTADNHAPGGYSCDNNFSKYKGNGSITDVYQIMHCQDELVRRYVDTIRKIDKDNNTAIVIIGDHMMHFSDRWHLVLKDDDRVYFVILNSGYEPQKIDYETAHYDLASIVLDVLGISQKEYKEKNKNITKFMNGFDVLYGLQTDVGLEYMKSRKVNALFDSLDDQDIASLRGQALRYAVKFLGNSQDVLTFMNKENKTFTKLATSKDIDIDIYSFVDNAGSSNLLRIKFNNTEGNASNYLKENLKKLELTIKYDNTQTSVHYDSIVDRMNACDENYCYLQYEDLSNTNEHVKLEYTLANGGGIMRFDVKAPGGKAY